MFHSFSHLRSFGFGGASKTLLRNENTQGDRTIRNFFTSRSEREIREALPDVHPRLWRYALTLTRDASEADDLTQEAVARGLSKASQFTPGTHVDRWLISILHRLWLNRLRAGKVRSGAGLVPVEEAGLTAPDNPEETFFGSEVLTAIMDLSEVQRVVVMLVYVEGYTYAEAAELVGVPVGTIMSRLAAARVKLKTRLGDKA